RRCSGTPRGGGSPDSPGWQSGPDNFDDTYGPLTAVMALLLWANLTGIALLAGIALAAQLKAVRAGRGVSGRAGGIHCRGVPASVGRSARRERHHQHVPERRSVHVDWPDWADAVPGPPIVAHEKCSRLAQGGREDLPPVRIEHRALPAGGVPPGDQQRRDQGDTVLVAPLGGCVTSTVSRAHHPERVYVRNPLRRVLDARGDLA